MKVYDNSKLVRMPYLKKTDVGRVSGYKRKDLNTLFDTAQAIDKQELGINYMFSYKVRALDKWLTIATLIISKIKGELNMKIKKKVINTLEEIALFAMYACIFVRVFLFLIGVNL